MKKRICLSILIAALLLASATACTTPNEPANEETEDSKAPSSNHTTATDDTETETEPVTEVETEPEEIYTYSEGLEYKKQGDVYVVTGIGTCADEVVVIPPTYNGRHVFGIEKMAFMDGTMRKVVIPRTISSIGDDAFAQCVNLTEAIVGYSEEGSLSCEAKLGKAIFRNCPSLTKVVLAEGITQIPEKMFYWCESLVQVSLPSTLRIIGQSAFNRCLSLESMTIPHGVTKIDAWAFEHCISLTSVYVPASVERSGNGNNSAFDDCSEDIHIYYEGEIWRDGLYIAGEYHIHCNYRYPTVPDSEPDGYSEGLVFRDNGDGTYSVKGLGTCKDTVVVIPPEYNGGAITAIDDYAFYGKVVKRVVIPEGVTIIGWDAFSGCRLTEVDIPQSVTIIADGAFSSCPNLARVTIPGGVTEFGSRVFYNCDSLTELVVESGITSLGRETFRDCGALTSVTLPNTLREIGYMVFADCPSLKEITLPEGLVTIDDDAFRSCHGLTSVTFPDSVVHIGRSVLSYCKGLTSVIIPGGVQFLSEFAFSNSYNLTDVYFKGSEESWNMLECDKYFQEWGVERIHFNYAP